MIHPLKIKARYFERILQKEKRFEIRRNDRDYQVGDLITFEIIPDGRSDAGGVHVTIAEYYRITYITDYEQQPGYVVFGIEREEPK